MKILYILLIALIPCTAHAQIRNLEVEPNHSTIGFRIPIAGFSVVTGKFMDYKINLAWNDENFTNSSISAEIQVNSINTGIADRDNHLNSEDFFHAERFPTITFESDSIRRIDFANFVTFGRLSMHGVTKQIEFPFTLVKMDGNTLGFSSRCTIDRMEYGVGSGFTHTSIPDFLAPKVQVEVDFWTRKRKE